MNKKILILYIVFASIMCCAYKMPEQGVSTQQPPKVELLEDSVSQAQYAITLKLANDLDLNKSKPGQVIVFTLPSTVNLAGGANIPAGTKFQAKIITKDTQKCNLGLKIKFIINEIIFPDALNYIILSNPPNIKPLKTISAEKILRRNAKVTGTFRLGTVIKEVHSQNNDLKLMPDTTTAVGICVLIYANRTSAKIKAGSEFTFTFEKNLSPEVMSAR